MHCFDSGKYFTDGTGGSSKTSSDTKQSSETSSPHIRNGVYCLNLTQVQVSAIMNLNNHLAVCTYNSEDLQDTINALAEALYMPDNMDEMLMNIFPSPVAAWMCLRSLIKGGGFSPPKLITRKLVAGQCGICLRIFLLVMKKWHQGRTTWKDASETEEDWFQ